MSEAAVSIALQTLQNLLLEELKFLYGVSHRVKDLQKELKELKYLLGDVDKQQHESESVLNWIREVRNLSHRAEDVTETYVVQVCSERRGKFMRVLLARFPCILNVLRRAIEGETSNANSKDPNERWKRQTYPIEIEDCFHRVIAVWGMGGIGKTTIARKVYNDVAIKRHFECFAWASITRQCNIRSVLENVLKQLTQHKREDIPNMSDGELIQQLCQIQKAKRCMVVLDDLWEIVHWDCLKNAFLGEGLNSKILLTTRNKNVANMVFAFKVGLLHIDDGVKLLMEKAFPHKSCAPG
ncbi:hypothetical protein CDL12_11933 [Handroanthus impetiginosus]|uniref:NB-ARC domain-containing protein n=1 Tax=Handroanthus impetiginosus TaxID=429701 RepID=A0A2G9HD32_9LAMI|nr:hypothetical protein CDL12_11933 [Handroanthus impetiginosus]